jgi:hypothetical protein
MMSRIYRSVAAACAVVALTLGASAAARAQSAAPPSAAPHAVGHLPIIDFVPTFTQSAIGGYDRTTDRAVPALQPFDVGGTVTFPITRKLSASFDRIVQGLYSQTLEPQGAERPRITAYRDMVYQYRVDDRMSPRWNLTGGFYSRHRSCCPASSAVAGVGGQANFASSEYHFGFVTLGYTTPAQRWLNSGTVRLQVSGLDGSVDHHVATKTGYFDQFPGKNKFLTAVEALTVTYPVDRKHGTVLSLVDSIGGVGQGQTYTMPVYYTAIVTAQLTKAFTKNFTLGMRTTNAHQAPKQNTPFVNGVIHADEVSLFADIKLDLNEYGRR